MVGMDTTPSTIPEEYLGRYPRFGKTAAQMHEMIAIKKAIITYVNDHPDSEYVPSAQTGPGRPSGAIFTLAQEAELRATLDQITSA